MWLALAVLIGYANVLNGEIPVRRLQRHRQRASVHAWSNWLAGLDHGIRPLLKFSYTLNWTMGTGVIGFHLTNLLIHLANAYLVYRLAQTFVQQQWQDRFRQVPLLTALLFAVHPVHTEAVNIPWSQGGPRGRHVQVRRGRAESAVRGSQGATRQGSHRVLPDR